jgi:DNA-binding XRE family transcriptional regulator
MAANMNSQKTLSKASKKYQPPKTVKPEHQAFMDKVGTKLMTLRKEMNLSTSALAKQAGISRNNYHYIETGRVYFNIESVLQVLDFFQADASEFFETL